MEIIGWTLVLGMCAVILASTIYVVVGILSWVVDEYQNTILRWDYKEVEHKQDIAELLSESEPQSEQA